MAFVFFNLRQTLVLKRFYATPINRKNIVFGEGLSRVCFQLLTSVVIILAGHFFFHFTLVNGLVTFLEMLVSVSWVWLFLWDLDLSSAVWRKMKVPSRHLPIFLPCHSFYLGGTFFSTQAFPKWLQGFCEILPLKQLNDAMRNVAFEGASLTGLRKTNRNLVIMGDCHLCGCDKNI